MPRRALPLVFLLAAACSDRAPRPDEQILAIPETERWAVPQLSRAVQVVRTEANIPHIYAHSRRDLAIVQGFVVARDRFFMMDLARRLGTGTISELLGDAALEVDQESRGTGMTYVADQILASLPPDLLDYLDAYAAGVNAYIDAVARDELPPPSELRLAFGLLGASSPVALMKPFDRRSVAGMLAVVLYDSSFETGDVGRAATAAALPSLFEGAPLGDLRRQGAIDDLWRAIEPIKPFASAPGLGTFVGAEGGATPMSTSARSGTVGGAPLPRELVERFVRRAAALQKRLNRDREVGFGSNAWAVSGAHSTDGAALLAGDGHLSLSVPSILYNLGLDTSVFGRGDTHQLGLTIPGFPVVAIGTNGKVAWSQTQLMGDITDWYREELLLGPDGRPSQSRFQGEWKDLVAVDESYTIADVPALDSVGRTETWTRWETFDGRWIAEVEGRSASRDGPLAPGEALINLQGSYVVPGDTDGDGIITAISFDYAGFDAGAILATTDALGHAADVHDFREKMRGLVGYSQNFAVADSAGNILYSAYQAVPCRAHLDRNPDGSWAEGADPTLLLDGTRYGSFRIPIANGLVDESVDDPQACVVPFEATPMAINPQSGFVATANNDPAGLSLDGSLTNDAWYIGGPWDTGFRADTIARRLEQSIAEGAADIAAMSSIQGDHHSPLGALLLEGLLASIDHVASLSAPTDPADQRALALYQSEASAIDEVEARLEGWAARGFIAHSGVETVYAPAPSADERDDAVATMIFNAWMSRVLAATFDDEGLPGVWQPSGTHGRVRALDRFLRGRGQGNPLGLASYNPATGESAFFDVLDTPEIETSHEIIVAALVDALAFLRSEPLPEDEPGTGGFATDDMNAWLWGLRHQAKLESLLAEFLGDSEEYAALTESFIIDTRTIPLTDPAFLPKTDPREPLRWFPRPGDQFGVDAANPGTSGTRFTHGSGPVMRMVVALKGDEVRGVNIIPGGQSALTDSPFFADQARLWLANQTLPMRFSVQQVVAGATGREVFEPR